MNRRFLAGSLLLLVACWVRASVQQKPEDKNSYPALAERLKNGDKTVDFRQLRLAYADSASYSSGPDTDAQRKAIMASLDRKDFTKAIKNADTVLAAKYVAYKTRFNDLTAGL